jgi:hypothetical protein
MSSIPAYDLTDPVTGKRCLSRNRRFNHPWYSSKKLDVSDNTNGAYYMSPTPQDETRPLRNVFFVPLHGGIQTL